MDRYARYPGTHSSFFLCAPCSHKQLRVHNAASTAGCAAPLWQSTAMQPGVYSRSPLTLPSACSKNRHPFTSHTFTSWAVLAACVHERAGFQWASRAVWCGAVQALVEWRSSAAKDVASRFGGSDQASRLTGLIRKASRLQGTGGGGREAGAGGLCVCGLVGNGRGEQWRACQGSRDPP